MKSGELRFVAAPKFPFNPFETDFSRAAVVTMFSMPELNLHLRPKILDVTPCAVTESYGGFRARRL